MRGTFIKVHPHGLIERDLIFRAPTLEDLQSRVGGYIEAVPGFSRFFDYDGPTPCVAFCDEEGKIKGLPVNPFATEFWRADRPGGGDVLVGMVVIVTGDDEFMGAL